MKTLRQWRQERLMSTRELAKAAGVAQKTIVQTEHGRHRPHYRTMRLISEALGVTARDVAEFAAALDADQGQQEAA